MFLYFRLVWIPLGLLDIIPTWVYVGRDGIAWRWLFFKRFVAFADLKNVSSMRGKNNLPFALVLEASDKTHRIPLAPASAGLMSHVTSVFEAYRSADPSRVDEWLPRASDEAWLAWVQRVRAKGAAAGSYRGMPVDHLWRVAEDASAPVDHRVGALLTLAGGPESRERAAARRFRRASSIPRRALCSRPLPAMPTTMRSPASFSGSATERVRRD